MEEEGCDWVPVPGGAWGVLGCVPESDVSVIECRGGMYMWHAGRQEQRVSMACQRREQCAPICSPDMFCIIRREVFSLAIR